MEYVPKWRLLNGFIPEVPIRVIFLDGIHCIIKRLERDDIDEALDLILEAISERYDPIISALDFNVDSFKSLIYYMMAHLDQDTAYGCFQVEGPCCKIVKLIAVDTLYVRNIRDEFKPSEDSGEAFGNWLTYLKSVERQLWAMGQGKICNFLSTFGVFILDQIKDKFEITKEMMQMRKKVAAALKIQVVGAAFIGEEIQKAVEEDGPSTINTYKTLHTYESNESTTLGLGDISEENIALTTVFPIKVMGLKQIYRTTKGDQNIKNKKGKNKKRKNVKKQNKSCLNCRANQFSI